MIEYIRDEIPQEELLVQLAEEAVELAHRALKLHRVLDGTNPTPVSLSTAFEDFEEEVADVLLCLKVLGLEDSDLVKYEALMDKKLKRWAVRIQEMRGEIYG